MPGHFPAKIPAKRVIDEKRLLAAKKKKNNAKLERVKKSQGFIYGSSTWTPSSLRISLVAWNMPVYLDGADAAAAKSLRSKAHEDVGSSWTCYFEFEDE